MKIWKKISYEATDAARQANCIISLRNMLAKLNLKAAINAKLDYDSFLYFMGR